MRDLAVLFIHLIATVARLPGGQLDVVNPFQQDNRQGAKRPAFEQQPLFRPEPASVLGLMTHLWGKPFAGLRLRLAAICHTYAIFSRLCTTKDC